MNLASITTVATRTVSKSVFTIKKFSPQILTTVGVVGVVASTVMASKATLNLESIVDESKENLDKAKSLHEQDRDDYTTEDYKKDVTTIYVQSCIKVAKNYWKPVTLGLVSLGCIIAAQGILHQRNVALMGAYKALETSFSKYRGRVADVIGAEEERKIRFDIKEEEIVEEDGTVTKVQHFGPEGSSQYARWFDENSDMWDKNHDYNMMTLRAAQNQANDKLHADGFIFLNDVYKSLGIPVSREGQIVGWVRNGDGDGFVDFGVYDFTNSDSRAFVNGWEKTILLDFNVDGEILDKI